MTIEEIRDIREKVKCPQLDGTPEYGQWGALRLEQRRAIARLCDELEYMIENYDNPILSSMHKYILDTHSFDDQLKHFYTEVCELTQAIYSNAGRDTIGKELADCYNFLDQIARHYSIPKPVIYNVKTLLTEENI